MPPPDDPLLVLHRVLDHGNGYRECLARPHVALADPPDRELPVVVAGRILKILEFGVTLWIRFGARLLPKEVVGVAVVIGHLRRAADVPLVLVGLEDPRAQLDDLFF